MEDIKKESTPLQRYKELRNKSLTRKKRSRIILFGYTVLVVLTLMVYYNYFGPELSLKSAVVSSDSATMRLTLGDRGSHYLATVTVKSLAPRERDLFTDGAVGDIAITAGSSEISEVAFGNDPGANIVAHNAYKAYTIRIEKSSLNEFAGRNPKKVVNSRSSFLARRIRTIPVSVNASLRCDASLKTKIDIPHEVGK